MAMVPSSLAQPVLLASVDHHPRALDPTADGAVEIRFRLARAAEVVVELWDEGGLLVKRFAEAEYPAAEHAVAWRGRDEAGRRVPPDAYYYTVSARAADGSEARHDPTDWTGGEHVRASRVDWNSETGSLRYALSSAARVAVRLQLGSTGPFLASPVRWAPRTVGEHLEHSTFQTQWEGEDLAAYGEISPQIQALSLPQNAIVVLPKNDRLEPIDDPTWPRSRRPRSALGARHRFSPLGQTPGHRSDVEIDLALPEHVLHDRDGRPLLLHSLTVRVEGGPDARQRMWDQRFAVAFFVDGALRYENPNGFLPLSWTLQPNNLNPGVHHLTVNLFGLEGSYGIRTLPFVVPSIRPGIEELRSTR